MDYDEPRMGELMIIRIAGEDRNRSSWLYIFPARMVINVRLVTRNHSASSDLVILGLYECYHLRREYYNTGVSGYSVQRHLR